VLDALGQVDQPPFGLGAVIVPLALAQLALMVGIATIGAAGGDG